MSRTVLFAGGPLHGQTMAVNDRATAVYALEPNEMSDPYLPRQVAYAVSRFAMCGRIIWIGHLGTEPDDDLAFEVLTSGGAKAASVLAPVSV